MGLSPPPPSYQRAASASPALRSLSIAHCSAPILCIMHICWMCSSHLAPHTSRLAIPHPFCAPHCITNNFAQLPTTSITYCFPATTGFTAPAQPAAPRTSTALNLAPRSSSCPSPPPATPEHALSFRTNGGENHRFLHLHNPICCTQPGVEPKPVQHTKGERQEELFARSPALKIFSRGACGCLLTRLIDLRHRAAVWRRQLKRLLPVRESWRSGNATQGCGPCATLEPPPTSSHCEP